MVIWVICVWIRLVTRRGLLLPSSLARKQVQGWRLELPANWGRSRSGPTCGPAFRVRFQPFSLDRVRTAFLNVNINVNVIVPAHSKSLTCRTPRFVHHTRNTRTHASRLSQGL